MQLGTFRVSEQHKGLDKEPLNTVWLHLKHWLHLHDLQHWNDMEVLEWVQGIDMKNSGGMEHLSWERWGCAAWRSPQEDHNAAFLGLNSIYKKDGDRVCSDRARGNNFKQKKSQFTQDTSFYHENAYTYCPERSWMFPIHGNIQVSSEQSRLVEGVFSHCRCFGLDAL